MSGGGGDEGAGGACGGVCELEAYGVEGEGASGAAPVVGVEGGEWSVVVVSDDRVSKGAHVGADLVEAPCLNPTRDERRGVALGAVAGGEDPVEGEGGLGGARVASRGGVSLHEGSFFALNARLLYGPLAAPRGGGWVPMDHSPVLFVDLASLKLGAEVVIPLGGEADRDEAAGASVKPVEEAKVSTSPKVLEAGAPARKEAVEEGVSLVPYARLCDDAAWFVEEGEVV